MPAFICTACGTQYPESAQPPAQCLICEEERQYVPPRGQTWTTFEALRASHMNAFHEHEPGVIGIGATPNFAIGQRAILVQTDGGNVLWDCIAPLDEAAIALIEGLGGLKAIAISHPHFYTTMVEWARAFDCPVHLHAADRDWVVRKDAAIRHWDGDTLRRPFPRRHGAALGGRRGRPRHRLRRRHPHRRNRPQVADLHAQLSEFHSAVAARGRGHRPGNGAVLLRAHLRSLFRPRHCLGRESRAGKIRRALHRGDRGDTGVLTISLILRSARSGRLEG
jgi:hypothetical protein